MFLVCAEPRPTRLQTTLRGNLKDIERHPSPPGAMSCPSWNTETKTDTVLLGKKPPIHAARYIGRRFRPSVLGLGLASGFFANPERAAIHVTLGHFTVLSWLHADVETILLYFPGSAGIMCPWADIWWNPSHPVPMCWCVQVLTARRSAISLAYVWTVIFTIGTPGQYFRVRYRSYSTFLVMNLRRFDPHAIKPAPICCCVPLKNIH
ncbi:hypothetical protein ARMGADRAFT_282885 [Armillaria gallica]|uniref:Uncharacterized protein n=1 Tax=Armillaria gallica TaxID=47427 RepID=A0A2H3D6R2_ARMGA|nr:hypothetical protein ARMGADRAFT_282885 [Armillaria gallica]